MKRLFLFCAALLLYVTGFAQFNGDINIVNSTNCDVDYQLYFSQRPPNCASHNASVLLTIPANTTVTYNLLGSGFPAPAWIGPPAPGGTDVWIGARVGFYNCGYYVSVGASLTCGFPGRSGTAGDPSCSPCQYVNVLWDPANRQLLIF